MKAKPGIEEVVRVCEGQRHAIECPNQRRINVVYANYARLEGAHICGWFILSTKCGISTSMAVVRHDCQGKQHCDLVATNGKFGGDPCLLTHKYLEVSNLKAVAQFFVTLNLHLKRFRFCSFRTCNINEFKGALLPRFWCMLANTAEIFDKEPLLQREIAVRAPGGKYEIISPRKSKLKSFSRVFAKIHSRNF